MIQICDLTVSLINQNLQQFRILRLHVISSTGSWSISIPIESYLDCRSLKVSPKHTSSNYSLNLLYIKTTPLLANQSKITLIINLTCFSLIKASIIMIMNSIKIQRISRPKLILFQKQPLKKNFTIIMKTIKEFNMISSLKSFDFFPL